MFFDLHGVGKHASCHVVARLRISWASFPHSSACRRGKTTAEWVVHVKTRKTSIFVRRLYVSPFDKCRIAMISGLISTRSSSHDSHSASTTTTRGLGRQVGGGHATIRLCLRLWEGMGWFHMHARSHSRIGGT